MDGFEWAEANLGATGPHALQDEGVNVYFAPQIAPGAKVVDLSSGQIEQFASGVERPRTGYYADFDSLERYSRSKDLPLNEVEGRAIAQRQGRTEAGDPLHNTEHPAEGER